MILYRSSVKKGGEDYSLSYTDSVNGTPSKGTCAWMFVENVTGLTSNNIVIGNNVNSCWRMFEGCYYFNGNVTIPSSVTNVGRMFWGCRNYNQNVIIPNSVNNTFGMFTNCQNFNQNIQLHDYIYEAREMFDGCIYKFNQNIQLPSYLTDARLMFSSCLYLNQKINIQRAYAITDCRSMFNRCLALNKEILGATNGYTWAKKGVDMSNMFHDCTNYDQTSYIPDNAVNCAWMFRNCTKLSSTIHFSPNFVGRDLEGICSGCNSPYIPFIPNSVLNIAFALNGCANLTDAWIDIGTGVNNCVGFLSNSNNFNGTLNFMGNVYRPITMLSLFSNNAKNKKTIYFGKALNNQINHLSIYYQSSQVTPTWITTSTGFYNTFFNIYCYWR